MMSTQHAKAETFRSLHGRARPLVLFNIWDAGSAKAVAATGARAIATGSWSVAAANGFPDGEKLPLDLAIDNLARITAATDLPVTIDLESGYGETANEVAHCVERAVNAGAVGCNLEDSFPRDGSLRDVHDQGERIAAARKAAAGANVPLFINARTDVFFGKPAEAHDGAMVQAALDRARAYAQAGADGLFVPGVIDDVDRASRGGVTASGQYHGGTRYTVPFTAVGSRSRTRQSRARALSRDDEYVERSRPYGGKRRSCINDPCGLERVNITDEMNGWTCCSAFCFVSC